MNKRISLEILWNKGEVVNLEELLLDNGINYQTSLVYGIHNRIEDKWYIGSTVVGIHQRFWKTFSTGHFTLVYDECHSFLTKENLKDFDLVFLYEDPLMEMRELRYKESEFITLYNSFKEGYNNTPSAQAGFYGKKHTERTKLQISETLRETNSDPEVKLRRSEVMKMKWETGAYDNANFNVPRSEEFKEFTSERVTGSRWMKKGSSQVFANSADIEHYLERGYEFGNIFTGVPHSLGKIWIVNKEEKSTYIYPTDENIKEYHGKGYAKGRYWASASYFSDLEDYAHLSLPKPDQLTDITSSTTIEKQS